MIDFSSSTTLKDLLPRQSLKQRKAQQNFCELFLLINIKIMRLAQLYRGGESTEIRTKGPWAFFKPSVSTGQILSQVMQFICTAQETYFPRGGARYDLFNPQKSLRVRFNDEIGSRNSTLRLCYEGFKVEYPGDQIIQSN